MLYHFIFPVHSDIVELPLALFVFPVEFPSTMFGPTGHEAKDLWVM